MPRRPPRGAKWALEGSSARSRAHPRGRGSSRGARGVGPQKGSYPGERWATPRVGVVEEGRGVARRRFGLVGLGVLGDGGAFALARRRNERRGWRDEAMCAFQTRRRVATSKGAKEVVVESRVLSFLGIDEVRVRRRGPRTRRGTFERTCTSDGFIEEKF